MDDQDNPKSFQLSCLHVAKAAADSLLWATLVGYGIDPDCAGVLKQALGLEPEESGDLENVEKA